MTAADDSAPPRRDWTAVRAATPRRLAGGLPEERRPHAVLTALADMVGPEDEPDYYGDHSPIVDLERRVAELLGKDAAVFMPSGTMAQQIALRVWCDRAGVRTVAFHPTSHLELHEHRAYHWLHGLTARLVGDPHDIIRLSDLAELDERLAVLLLELPQREIGGRLPEWDDLVAQSAWARANDVRLHMDGARLWECAPYYARSYAEIVALFDTVYVSLYKGVAGIAGCCLAGPSDVMAEARVWRARHGGTLYAMYPYVLAAQRGLDTKLGRMDDYYAKALEIADALRHHPDVEVVPDPPQSPMMHLLLRTDADGLYERGLDLAAETGVWTFAPSKATTSPSWRQVELAVGESTLGFAGAEVRALLDRLLRTRD